MNGDSSKLPVPAGTVDAVVTDPPYFDFVHYSELSDFFFAWLSPALRNRYSWMAREDSSDPGKFSIKIHLCSLGSLRRCLLRHVECSRMMEC